MLRLHELQLQLNRNEKGVLLRKESSLFMYKGDKTMQLIDAHIHIGKHSFCDVENSNFKYDLCATYEEVIELMDMNNIGKAVILPIPHKDFDTEKTNDYVFEAYQKYPDRLIPFCRIDEHLEENLKKGFYEPFKNAMESVRNKLAQGLETVAISDLNSIIREIDLGIAHYRHECQVHNQKCSIDTLQSYSDFVDEIKAEIERLNQ